MNIDHAKLERLAREICDSRNGAGHYDAKGTKRQHWRWLALELVRVEMERAHEAGALASVLAMVGLATVMGVV